ncbi:HD domain-containing protein 2-like isoform X1 [Terrapene carolina triunguis]|uniref:HD domain-containing protein 2-like isoform X1 n=1 Tax=Terrapene triunguis TaxID=2587831 RepID=UPI000E775A9D|nr:HD domain-containing protein 2-like isoform X1 [Terrapene carolina triunguis]
MFYIVKTISKQRVPRTGWVYRNVEKPESVSDHMYRMAVMALVTEDKQLNKDRCVRLALVHDMAECIVGDIAPADNISKEEKHQREEAAMKHLTQLLSEGLRKEIYELWEVSINHLMHLFHIIADNRTNQLSYFHGVWCLVKFIIFILKSLEQDGFGIVLWGYVCMAATF